jgi:hypothetical protein
MIVVRVELHSAITGQVTELARMNICNEGGTNDVAQYGGYVARGRDKAALDRSVQARSWQHTGTLTDWHRHRHHVWNLVLSMLLACGYRGPMPHEHNQQPMRERK